MGNPFEHFGTGRVEKRDGQDHDIDKIKSVPDLPPEKTGTPESGELEQELKGLGNDIVALDGALNNVDEEKLNPEQRGTFRKIADSLRSLFEKENDPADEIDLLILEATKKELAKPENRDPEKMLERWAERRRNMSVEQVVDELTNTHFLKKPFPYDSVDRLIELGRSDALLDPLSFNKSIGADNKLDYVLSRIERAGDEDVITEAQARWPGYEWRHRYPNKYMKA